MVVLPAPDGAENIMSLPSGVISSSIHLLIGTLVQSSGNLPSGNPKTNGPVNQ
jgi:hypothetical protein